jgi:hypothetical protein
MGFCTSWDSRSTLSYSSDFKRGSKSVCFKSVCFKGCILLGATSSEQFSTFRHFPGCFGCLYLQCQLVESLPCCHFWVFLCGFSLLFKTLEITSALSRLSEEIQHSFLPGPEQDLFLEWRSYDLQWNKTVQSISFWGRVWLTLLACMVGRKGFWILWPSIEEKYSSFYSLLLGRIEGKRMLGKGLLWSPHFGIQSSEP